MNSTLEVNVTPPSTVKLDVKSTVKLDVKRLSSHQGLLVNVW